MKAMNPIPQPKPATRYHPATVRWVNLLIILTLSLPCALIGGLVGAFLGGLEGAVKGLVFPFEHNIKQGTGEK